MGETMSLKINEDVVRAVIEEKVAEAVGLATVDKDRVMAQLIDKMLNLRVDSDGKPCTYGSAVPFIEYASREAMQRAVRVALEKAFAEQEKAITALVVKQIASNKNKLAKALVGGMKDSLTSRWSSKIIVALDGSCD